MDLIKIFQTQSGNTYVYNVKDNKIISINKEWYQSISDIEKEDLLLHALNNSGIRTAVPEIEFDFNFSLDQLWYAIENEIESLTLEVTQQCSLRCTYCIYSGNYQDERTHQDLYMSRELLIKCIDYYYLHSGGVREGHISFYGGESLLRFSDIQYAISYARRKWKTKPISFQISTNGTTLTDDVLDWLNMQDDTTILITCNGPVHDLYRRFPNGIGSLDTVMRAINKIKNKYPALWKRTNLIANVSTRAELIALRNFYIERIGKPPLDVTGIKSEYGNEVIQNLFQYKDDVQDKDTVVQLYCEDDPYIKNYANINGICMRQLHCEDNVVKKTMFCKPLAHSLFISADGVFRPCEEMSSKIDFGDIYSGYSREKIIAMLHSIQNVFKTRCNKCWARRLCTVCFAGVHIDKNGKYILPQSYCEENLKVVENELRMFCEVGEKNPNLIQKIIDKYSLMNYSKQIE